MKNYSIKNYFTAIVIFFCTFSCVKERFDGAVIDDFSFNVDVSARDATFSSLELQNIYVITVTNDGRLFPKYHTIDNYLEPHKLNVRLREGNNKIFLIGNVTSELRDKLSLVTTEEEINKIVFSSADLTPPVPMFGLVTGLVVTVTDRDAPKADIKHNGTLVTNIDAKLTRAICKTRLTIIKNIPAGTEDFAIEQVRVKVCRIPKYSTLTTPTPYTETLWSSDLTISKSCSLKNNGSYTINGDGEWSVPAGIDNVEFPEIYLPEHILAEKKDVGSSTYLYITTVSQPNIPNAPKITTSYTVNLGDLVPIDYNMYRNTLYNVYATITKLGALGIHAEVVPSIMLEIPVNWAPVDGLVIVSDLSTDFDQTTGESKNVNVWNNYSVYSGILKSHNKNAYTDVVFKYGSLTAIKNDTKSIVDLGFIPPLDASTPNDIVWYPTNYISFDMLKTWTTIPCVVGGVDIPIDNSMVSSCLGDPCKLAGLSQQQIKDGKISDNLQWHMATEEELNLLISERDETVLNNDFGLKTFHALTIPYAKSRNTTGLLASNHNKSGRYWVTKGAQALSFTNGTAPSLVACSPHEAHTIRCVRNKIPDSYLMIIPSQKIITYQGGSSSFRLTTNMTHWRMELVTSGEHVGTATDFSAFSFSNTSTIHSMTGEGSNRTIEYYIGRKEATSSRSYTIKVEGTGFDGKRLTNYVSVMQSGYVIKSALTIDSFTDEMLPKTGGTYTINVHLTPDDIPLPVGAKFSIHLTYLGVELKSSTEVTITDAITHSYTVTIEVPENETPDIRGVTFVCKLNKKEIGDILQINQDNKVI